MNLQRVLLRLLSSGWLPGFGRRWLHDRVWTIEGGQGAGLKLRLPQNQEYIFGNSESPVQDALALHLRPGAVFYDVGANVGFFSLIAAKVVGVTGWVYAFEPVSENAAAARENAALNQFENLTLHEVAVGKSSGTADLLLTDWNGGATLSTVGDKPPDTVSMKKVRVVALDDHIQAERLRPPDLVKIDVEGAELEVIQGMSRTITEFKPVLLYEIDDGDREAFERRWKELDDHVARFGYQITRLADSYPNLRWNVGHSLALPSGRVNPVRPDLAGGSVS